MMGRERKEQMVIHSSVVLLQERFRQLQRAREMRAQRELHNTTTTLNPINKEMTRAHHHRHHILQYNEPTGFNFFQFLPLNSPTTSQVVSLSLCLDPQPDTEDKLSFCLWPNIKDNMRAKYGSVLDDKINGGFDRNDDVDTSLHL